MNHVSHSLYPVGVPAIRSGRNWASRVRIVRWFSIAACGLGFVFGVSAQNVLQLETSPLGDGVVVQAQNVPAGTSVIAYAIERDNQGNFVANIAADSWSLTNITGGVLSSDLVVAGDSMSATFTSHAAGSAVIYATSGALPPASSGTLTAVSARPTIGNIGDQSTFEDQPTELVSVPIDDRDTPAINLTLSATSSNPGLVANTNIYFYDYDWTNHKNRSISIVPSFGQLGTSTISVVVSDGTSTATNSFVFTVNPPPPGSARFANPTPIVIPVQGMASPYGSPIVVSNMPGVVTKLQVTISSFSHAYPGDVDMLLVSPAGQKMVIWSRAGDSGGTNNQFLYSATNITTTLDDAAVFPLPYPYPFISIPFRPGDYSTVVPPAASFPSPAPAPPYDTPVAMSDYNGYSPNGTWLLYVYDFMEPDSGIIQGGWSMMIATALPPNISPIVDQSSLVNTPTPAIPFDISDAQTAASNLVLTVTTSNPGLVPTTNIVLAGSDTNRTVTLTPVAGQTGNSVITLTVANGAGLTNSTTFNYTVSYGHLTANIDNQNRAYGVTNPVLTGTLTGVQPGDGITMTLNTAATPLSPIGNYPILPTFNDPNNKLGNYVIATNGGTLDITQASLTITANSSIKVYGQTVLYAGTEFSAVGLVNGDSVSQVLLSSAGAPATASTASYLVAVSGATGSGLSNYSINYVDGILTVNAAGLTITANNTTKTYGQTLTFAGTEFSTLGLVNSDTVTSVSLTSSGSAATAPTGGYTIVPSTAIGSGLGNYTVSYADGSLTVAAAPLGVTADDKSRQYGQPNPALTVTFTGFVNGDGTNNLSGTLSVGTSADTNSPVGTYAITASGLSGTNYSLFYTNGTLAVTPYGLTVTAQAASKTYGQSDPEFTASFNGFVNGDNTNSLQGTLQFSRQPGETIGAYTVTPSGLTSTNYSITYSNGTLTVNPAALTITASNIFKTYGQALGFVGTEFSTLGLVSGDAVNSVTLSSAGTPASAGTGGYSILPSAAVGTGLTNYNITYANGTLTVNPAGLTVTANNTNKIYGQVITLAGTEFSVLGLVNADSVSSVTLSSLGTPGSAAAATYPITATNALGSGLINYTISYVNGTLTVNPIALTVSATATNKIYGNADPALTYRVTSGALINGDTFSGSLSRVAGENVANYAIQQGTLTAGANYNVSFVSAIFRITKRALTVQANNASRQYGLANPAFTASYVTFVNGDTPSSLGGTLTFGTAATPASAIGNYSITPSGLTASNYSLSYALGSLSVTQAPLSITANSTSKPFGHTVTFAGTEFTANGLFNSDHVNSASLSSAGASAFSPTGAYSITASAASGTGLANYSISYVNGILTVTPAVTVQLTSVGKGPGNSTQIAGTGDTNMVYSIQTSPDMLQWQKIGSAQSDASGTFQFQDTNAPTGMMRLYRAALP